MATESAAVGASAGAGAVSSAAGAIKAFVLSNPASLAAVAGLAVGVLAYHFLFDHAEHLVADHEHQAGDADANAAETTAP